MIGSNGGLIGTSRAAANANSLPGVWTLGEQVVARSIGNWPQSISGGMSFSVASIGNISAISNSGVTTVSLSNLISLLNTSTFQDRAITTNSYFTLPSTAVSAWSFSWANVDLTIIPKMYLRAQRLGGGNSSWQIQGSGIQSLSATTSSTNTEYTINMLASNGNATITILNAYGLAIQDIAFGGGTQGNFLVSWSQA